MSEAIYVVAVEIERLRSAWQSSGHAGELLQDLDEYFSAEELADIDSFDRLQLAAVITTCRESRSLSEAGRTLFQASRRRKKNPNDADRLRKYLARFGLDWKQLTTA